MQIVIATPLYPPDIGGPAAYAKEFSERFTAAGHEVVLVSFSHLRRYPKFLRHIIFFFRVFRVARGADAVLGFDTWSTGIPAVVAGRLRGAKTLIRIGGDVLWEWYVERTGDLVRLSDFYEAPKKLSVKERLIFKMTCWLARTTDALVFTTAWHRDLWRDAYAIREAKSVVIENAYPRERDSFPAKKRVFVAAARDIQLKNTALLKQVFARIHEQHPESTLDTRVLPPGENKLRIQEAYAVIIPSVSEVNPNTAIDALRYGKPFIMTSDTGARERLGDAGIFIDTLNAAELQAAIEKLLDPVEYSQACAKVRAVTFSHSWDEVANDYIHLIQKLCAL